jgi:hypothetical protein
MFVHRRTLYVAPFTLSMLVTSSAFSQEVAAAMAPPQGVAGDRTLFTWNGTIDKEVVIQVNGRQVETRASGLDASFAPRLEQRDDLPRVVGNVDAHIANGRGDVDVLQQPSARNDYTALVRIRDPRGGTDNYRVVVTWQPIDVRYGGANDGRGRGDDDWNRDDRNRDDRRRDDGRNRDRVWVNGRWEDRSGRDAGRLSWRGDVDDVSEIRIQGRRVEYFTRSGQPIRNDRIDLRGNPLPRRSVDLELDVSRGRGDVLVVQQPNARNGFTAIVQITDKRRGYGDYDFDLRWN